jgi:hypothetical protein
MEDHNRERRSRTPASVLDAALNLERFQSRVALDLSGDRDFVPDVVLHYQSFPGR